jgi:hypothetical protein
MARGNGGEDMFVTDDDRKTASRFFSASAKSVRKHPSVRRLNEGDFLNEVG